MLNDALNDFYNVVDEEMVQLPERFFEAIGTYIQFCRIRRSDQKFGFYFTRNGVLRHVVANEEGFTKTRG